MHRLASRSRHEGQAVAAWAQTSMLAEGWVLVGGMPQPPKQMHRGATRAASDVTAHSDSRLSADVHVGRLRTRRWVANSQAGSRQAQVAGYASVGETQVLDGAQPCVRIVWASWGRESSKLTRCPSVTRTAST